MLLGTKLVKNNPEHYEKLRHIDRKILAGLGTGCVGAEFRFFFEVFMARLKIKPAGLYSFLRKENYSQAQLNMKLTHKIHTFCTVNGFGSPRLLEFMSRGHVTRELIDACLLDITETSPEDFDEFFAEHGRG